MSGWELLAKSLRPPPEKFHGLEDVETRYRRRELDLIANEETRELFAKRAAHDRRGSPLARRARLRRGRDAGAAAALRRRAGAALRHPPQRPRPRPLPADRDRALSEAAASSAASTGSTSSARTSATRASPTSTTPSSRCSSGTRPTRTTTTPRSASSSWSRRRRGGARHDQDRARRRQRSSWPRPGGGSTLRDAIRERTGHRHRRAPDPRAARGGDGLGGRPTEGWGKLVDGLLSKEVEPNLIQPTFVTDYPVELSPFAKAHRSRGGPGGALGGLRRRDRDRQLLHRAQRSRRAAPALRAAAGGGWPAATRRPSPSTRPSSRRSRSGCPPPAGSASASTAW